MNHIFVLTINAGAGFLATLPFLILLEVLARKTIPSLSLMHIVGDGIFTFFLSAILSITGIPAIYRLRFDPNVQLIPFSDLSNNAIQYVQNVLLFIPIGILLPVLFSRYRNIFRTLRYGFLLSLGVELLQLFSFRATDVDDLLMNTFGAVFGYGIFVVLHRAFPKVTDRFCLFSEKENSIPALLSLETVFLTAAAWAGALLLSPVINDSIWGILLNV